MKKIILSLILLFGLIGVVSASSIYTAFIDQGIVVTPNVGERAYYPSVIFDGVNYFMVYDNKTAEGYVGNYAISNDGVNWTLGGSISGVKDNNHSYHTVMLYDSDGFGGDYNYKIWYLDLNANVPHGTGSIRYAESNNGINWVNDQAVFGGNMIVSGDDNIDAPARTWGPGTVIYNPDATNTGGNPLDYSYAMYYDGYNGITDDPDWDSTEALFLAYSQDGINWNKYTRNPVLKGSIIGEWDAGCAGYPTIMKIEDGSYIMWYSGGVACNEGIGFAISSDAINWTKDGDNPMLHKSDITNPEGYRAERTYTPRVINDGSGELKMYYSAKSDAEVYAVGLATLELPVLRTAEITSPEENEMIFAGTVDFKAFLVDDDEDFVDWAVRKGTCAAGQGTVFGNVDGHSDVFDIDYNANTYTYYYSITADVSSWEPGMYCFIFNPREDADEKNIRLTRSFWVVDGYVGGGGHLLEEIGDKRKDWLDVSFGGAVANAGSDGLIGEWEVNFHNVNEDGFDKSKFHTTNITNLNFYTGNDPSCHAAITYPVIR